MMTHRLNDERMTVKMRQSNTQWNHKTILKHLVADWPSGRMKKTGGIVTSPKLTTTKRTKKGGEKCNKMVSGRGANQRCEGRQYQHFGSLSLSLACSCSRTEKGSRRPSPNSSQHSSPLLNHRSVSNAQGSNSPAQSKIRSLVLIRVGLGIFTFFLLVFFLFAFEGEKEKKKEGEHNKRGSIQKIESATANPPSPFFVF